MAYQIITCPQWKARKPKAGLTLTRGKAQRFIIHHTAGHVRQIREPAVTTKEEAMQYARDIQRFHMDNNGWNDSGHNFLVCRNGFILQGRWLTVSSIEAEHMVVSAHCPGQNEQIGIEHEHYGTEKMTLKQFEASAWLQAWCSDQYDLDEVLPAAPHKQFYATACPANLVDDIAKMTTRANVILRQMRL